jgi:hypothetical protein
MCCGILCPLQCIYQFTVVIIDIQTGLWLLIPEARGEVCYIVYVADYQSVALRIYYSVDASLSALLEP